MRFFSPSVLACLLILSLFIVLFRELFLGDTQISVSGLLVLTVFLPLLPECSLSPGRREYYSCPNWSHGFYPFNTFDYSLTVIEIYYMNVPYCTFGAIISNVEMKSLMCR